jgi:hypothetical protein
LRGTRAAGGGPGNPVPSPSGSEGSGQGRSLRSLLAVTVTFLGRGAPMAHVDCLESLSNVAVIASRRRFRRRRSTLPHAGDCVVAPCPS